MQVTSSSGYWLHRCVFTCENPSCRSLGICSLKMLSLPGSIWVCEQRRAGIIIPIFKHKTEPKTTILI